MQQVQLLDQTDATFQEVFLQASLMKAIRLLLFCITVAVPFHYISGIVANVSQQDEGIPAMSEPHPTEPDPHALLVPGPPVV